MNMDHNKSTTLILHHLRTIFKKIVPDLPLLEKAEVEGRKQVRSLANLLNQRLSVQAAFSSRDSPVVKDFPDIQTRLLVKISGEVDSKVEELRISLIKLKDHHDRINRARSEILTLLQKHGSELDQEAFHLGSAAIPPIQVMLGWVDGLELELRELYFARVYYLDNILDKDTITPENMLGLWMQESGLINILHDCSEQTKFFLEDAGR